MKFLLLAALAAVAAAEPGYYNGYGYYGAPGYYGYPGQYSWPAARAPGFSSTCFGCRGKRSAEPEPEPVYGYYGFGPYYGGYPGYYRGYGAGVAGHPTGVSYTQRSPQGLRGKRSADDEAEAPEAAVEAAPRAYAMHPNNGMSWVANQVWGRGKRSAEPEPGYYGGYYGYPGYGYHGYGARSYVGRTVYGYPGRYYG